MMIVYKVYLGPMCNAVVVKDMSTTFNPHAMAQSHCVLHYKTFCVFLAPRVEKPELKVVISNQRLISISQPGHFPITLN